MQVASQMLSALSKGVTANPLSSPTTDTTLRPGQGATNFVSSLTDALKEVNRLQVQASSNSEQSVRGNGPSLDRLMIEGQEAGLAFQMSMQFRNKALEAYQDVMKMQF